MKKGRGRGGGDRIDVWPRSSAIFEALPSAGADAPAKGSICLLGIGVSGTTGDPRRPALPCRNLACSESKGASMRCRPAVSNGSKARGASQKQVAAAGSCRQHLRSSTADQLPCSSRVFHHSSARSASALRLSTTCRSQCRMSRSISRSCSR